MRRWMLPTALLVGCGRIHFDPVGATAGDDDGGTTPVVTTPVIVSQIGAVASCLSIVWDGGGWGIAWRDTRNGLGELYFRRVALSGAVGPELRITNNPAETECPSLTWTGTQYAIAYADDRSGKYEIYLQRFDGSSPGAELKITTSMSLAEVPALAWTPSGTYMLVWHDSAGLGANVRSLWLDANGTALAPLSMFGTLPTEAAVVA